MADSVPETPTPTSTPADRPPSPWLVPAEAAARARVSTKTIYAAVRRGDLKAARVGGRRSIRILPEWVDAWLRATAEPEISRGWRVAR
jgi:excisionase family DNA binding protein